MREREKKTIKKEKIWLSFGVCSVQRHGIHGIILFCVWWHFAAFIGHLHTVILSIELQMLSLHSKDFSQQRGRYIYYYYYGYQWCTRLHAFNSFIIPINHQRWVEHRLFYYYYYYIPNNIYICMLYAVLWANVNYRQIPAHMIGIERKETGDMNIW